MTCYLLFISDGETAFTTPYIYLIADFFSFLFDSTQLKS